MIPNTTWLASELAKRASRKRHLRGLQIRRVATPRFAPFTSGWWYHGGRWETVEWGLFAEVNIMVVATIFVALAIGMVVQSGLDPHFLVLGPIACAGVLTAMLAWRVPRFRHVLIDKESVVRTRNWAWFTTHRRAWRPEQCHLITHQVWLAVQGSGPRGHCFRGFAVTLLLGEDEAVILKTAKECQECDDYLKEFADPLAPIRRRWRGPLVYGPWQTNF